MIIYLCTFTIKINHVPQESIIRPLFLVGAALPGTAHRRRCSCLRALVRLTPPRFQKTLGLSLGENESDIMWTIELLGTHTLIENKQNKSKQFLPHQLAHETWDDKNTCSNPVTPRCFGVFRFSKLRYLMMLIFFGVFFEMVVPAMTA